MQYISKWARTAAVAGILAGSVSGCFCCRPCSDCNPTSPSETKKYQTCEPDSKNKQSMIYRIGETDIYHA